MKHSIVLPLEKETKGALLYRDKEIAGVNPLYLIDGVYIRKAGMATAAGLGDNTWPRRITLTIES